MGLYGVSSGVFTTTVQPAARAGATLRVSIAGGKFHYNIINNNIIEYQSYNDKVY